MTFYKRVGADAHTAPLQTMRPVAPLRVKGFQRVCVQSRAFFNRTDFRRHTRKSTRYIIIIIIIVIIIAYTYTHVCCPDAVTIHKTHVVTRESKSRAPVTRTNATAAVLSRGNCVFRTPSGNRIGQGMM